MHKTFLHSWCSCWGGGVTANRDGLSEGKRSFWVVREGSGGLAGWSA